MQILTSQRTERLLYKIRLFNMDQFAHVDELDREIRMADLEEHVQLLSNRSSGSELPGMDRIIRGSAESLSSSSEALSMLGRFVEMVYTQYDI